MRHATKQETYLRLRRRLGSVPRQLWLLLAAATVLSVCWTSATAPLNGPDESAHVSYTQNLAENGKRPQNLTGSGTESTEVASADYFFNLHPSVGVLASRPNWSQADRRTYKKTESEFTSAERKNAGGPNAEAKTPPLYYVYQAVVYRIGYGLHVMDRFYLMRLANIPLYLATIVFTWLLAGLLFRRPWVQFTATALVALQPMASFMSGVVNPDILLGTEWAGFAYAGTLLVLRGPSRWRIASIVLLVVASFLTQGRGIPLIVPAVLALLLSLWRHRERYPRAIWVTAGVGAVVAIAAVVVLKNRAAYGGELTLGKSFNVPGFLSYLWQFYLPRLPNMSPPPGPSYGWHQLMVEEFFAGRFGSLEVSFGAAVYALVQLVVALALAGLAAAVIAQWQRIRHLWDVGLLLAVIGIAQLVLLHLVSYRSLAGQTGDPLIVGRYLLPFLSLYGVGLAFAAQSAGRRVGPYIAAAFISGSLALEIGGLAITAVRFYG